MNINAVISSFHRILYFNNTILLLNKMDLSAQLHDVLIIVKYVMNNIILLPSSSASATSSASRSKHAIHITIDCGSI